MYYIITYRIGMDTHKWDLIDGKKYSLLKGQYVYNNDHLKARATGCLETCVARIQANIVSTFRMFLSLISSHNPGALLFTQVEPDRFHS